MKELLSKKRVQMIYVVILALLVAYAAVRVGVASIGKKEELLDRGAVVTNIIALFLLGGLIVAFLPKGFDRLLEDDKTSFTFVVMLLFLAVTALLAFFSNRLIESKNENDWNPVYVIERYLFFIFLIIIFQSILYFSFRNKPGLYLAVLWILFFLPFCLGYFNDFLQSVENDISSFLRNSKFFTNDVIFNASFYSFLFLFIFAIVGLITFIRKRKKLQGRELSRKILQTSLIWCLSIVLLPFVIVLIILSFVLGDSGSSILVLFFKE